MTPTDNGANVSDTQNDSVPIQSARQRTQLLRLMLEVGNPNPRGSYKPGFTGLAAVKRGAPGLTPGLTLKLTRHTRLT